MQSRQNLYPLLTEVQLLLDLPRDILQQHPDLRRACQ
jgi:hypothetical protein